MSQVRWQDLPKATVVLIGVNVLFYAYLAAIKAPSSSWMMIEKGALYVPAILENHEFYRLVTSMFMHFSFRHLFFNMLLLYFMGDILERRLGPVVFLFIYFTTGLFGNAASLIYYAFGQANVVSAGASGAIFGLVGVVAYLVFRNRGYFQGISSRQIILMIVFSLYSGITGSGVNNAAHVAGLLSGIVCGMVFCHGHYDRQDVGS